MKKAAFTLVEMLISMTIMTIIIVMISPMMDLSFTGIVTYEVHNSLKQANQTAINYLGHELTESYRLFQRGAAADAYLARLDLADQPPPLAGADSRLPVIQASVAAMPGVPGAVGNCLLFATRRAPVSVAGGAVTLDTYRFNFYYIGQVSALPLGNRPHRNLYEWHSIDFVDYNMLSGIADPLIRTDALIELFNLGYRFAWDPIQDADEAFYNIDVIAGVPVFPLPEVDDATHRILKASGGEAIKIHTKGVISNFRHGIAHNTNNTDFILKHPVPLYATANGDFPSGFEAIIVGMSSKRLINIRMVAVAQGAFKGYKSNQQVLQATAKDSW